jgi:phosphoribosylamine--glycine ligase
MKTNNPLRILILGKDARTDAIASACLAGRRNCELFAFSDYNNPGFLAKCKHLAIGPLNDVAAILRYADEIRPDLTIIGPEEPLAAGVVDALTSIGIPCFGPQKDLARIETSKAWTRELLAKYHIGGNPNFQVFTSTRGLARYLHELGEYVIKPDGLTSGKGVKLSSEHLTSDQAAIDYATEVIQSHGRVVIEEKLQGEEFSLQSITDGTTILHCPVVQDHKRVGEGDVGPNTGGMGSYSCADFSLPFLSDRDVVEAKAINTAVMHAIREETGRPYRGVLYGGFIATRSGTRLIEYNARFGDPEAMNILPLLETDFVELCLAVANGRLNTVFPTFRAKCTVCKYVVPDGYPVNPVKDRVLQIPKPFLQNPDIRVYFAGVDKRDADWYLTGSRAVAFVGIADTLDRAERLAEAAAASVKGPVIHRRDIGTSKLVRSRIQHMSALRDRRDTRLTNDNLGTGGGMQPRIKTAI